MSTIILSSLHQTIKQVHQPVGTLRGADTCLQLPWSVSYYSHVRPRSSSALRRRTGQTSDAAISEKKKNETRFLVKWQNGSQK